MSVFGRHFIVGTSKPTVNFRTLLVINRAATKRPPVSPGPPPPDRPALSMNEEISLSGVFLHNTSLSKLVASRRQEGEQMQVVSIHAHVHVHVSPSSAFASTPPRPSTRVDDEVRAPSTDEKLKLALTKREKQWARAGTCRC